MNLTLSLEEIYRLRKPCQNRGLKLEVNVDYSICIINPENETRKHFTITKEAEDYLSTIPRIDI